VPVEHIKFDSASEYACACLLEKYTKWEAHPGATLQIPIGRCSYDFLVGNTLVEYHPISLKHEFITDALSDILSAARFITKDKKAELLSSIADEFRAQYIKRRGQVASAHPTYQHCEVVCVFSPEEFIDKVLRPHATCGLGATKDLALEFRALLRGANKGRRGG
jgi:hypothetical protein